MDINDMILYSSLKHLPDISDKREKEYWKNGVLNLSQLYSFLHSQATLFDNCSNGLILQSVENISNGEIDTVISELSRKSGRKDYYRIAYSFPKDIMFLDIETTGLSQVYHYVTTVGWVMDGVYSYWMPGMDSTFFLDSFKKAKMIVTFNGAKFDCPFLNLTFKEIEASKKPNLDLMYLCRSFGYMKGQKTIEERVGFQRPIELSKCDGKEAIALWYKFLFGDNNALRELITYNFYDIFGMMHILDHIFFEHIYNKTFPKVGKPSRFFSKHLKKAMPKKLPATSQIKDYVKHNISNFDIKNLSCAMQYKIVGIDLAGVINKTSKTGICVLKGQDVTTSVVKTDDEIISYIQEAAPDIVSIDAPLSLPYGRSTVFNDDPKRDEIGIMRFCERELKRRGVNVYPALIDSMQELTKRGIELSEKLRKLGHPVIECFPGAAQDVLQIPRKKTDETLLKTGLTRIGIRGDFENRKVSDDELDAITAALVGQFFIAEYYEPIGIEAENDLIIPQTKKMLPQYDIVIGVTGPIAAGKTTVAKYLQAKGYAYCRYSQIIADALKDKNISVDRKTLQKTGWDLFSNMNQYKLNQELDKKVSGNPMVVIDGLRHYEDFTYWKERSFKRFFLIYVDSDYAITSARYAVSNPDEDYNEIFNHPAEAEIAGLKRYADIVLPNNDSIQKLESSVDDAIKRIIQSIK